VNEKWIWIGGAGEDGYGMELSADKAYNKPHDAALRIEGSAAFRSGREY
jgi:hypothetical protein